ncbi:MAG: TonB-dependent receptor [Polyangiaceae bacterium]
MKQPFTIAAGSLALTAALLSGVGARAALADENKPAAAEPAPQSAGAAKGDTQDNSAGAKTDSGSAAAPADKPKDEGTGLVVGPPGPPYTPEEAAQSPTEVTVEGDKSAPGAVSLGRRQIREMPGVLADPYRAIEVEPGVTPVTSGVPYYFIRGAPPGNVGYYYDGIQVPLLFHVGAGPGVIPAGLVNRVELHLGPYPASFGRMAGAIVDAESVPARDDWHAEGVFRGVDIGGLLEGPLPDGKGSLLIGGHYAVGAEVLSLIVPSIDISYADYQARATFNVSREGKFSILGFGAYDYLASVDGDARDVLIDSDFHRVDLRYDHDWGDGTKVRVSTTLGLDESRGIGVESAKDYKLATRVTAQKPIGNGTALLRGGLDLSIDSFEVVPGGDQDCTTFVCSGGGGPLGGTTQAELGDAFEVLFPNRIDLALGAWMDALIVLGPRATITPGIRFDYYHSMGESDFAIDPKLVGRFGITDNFRLVPAIGLASQQPGFPPIPGLQIGGLPGGLQRSLQASFGAEATFGPVDLHASAFRQVTFNMTDSIGAGRGTGFGADRFLNRSTGDAYGLELSARGALRKDIFFLASYTLSKTVRSRDGLAIPSAYDRTHVAQLAVLFDFGNNWKGGLRMLVYSGFPAEEATPGHPLSEDPDRVKPFYRLDARLSKRWLFGDRAYVGLVLDMQNATLTKETFDVQCDDDGKCKPREIGPITIPTLVLEAGY